MKSLVQAAGQVIVLIAVFAAVAGLSDWPGYSQLPPDKAMVKLSFSHGSDRTAECRQRTPEELAKLPPNMRAPLVCPRTRPPIYVELDIDGQTVFRASLPPSGIWGDGPSRVYQRFILSAGTHEIAVRMRDTPRIKGFNHSKVAQVVLSPEANFVIDFRQDGGGFVFR